MWSNTFGCSATSAFFVVLLLHEPPQCCLRDSTRRHHSLSIQAEEECLMRVFMTSFVALLALVAISPQMATAGHGGGGGHSGGGGGHFGGGGGHWRTRRPMAAGGAATMVESACTATPTDTGMAAITVTTTRAPYVVQKPILEIPAFSGLPIEINNPATSGVTLSYVLNDVTYSIPPGYSQNLTLDRSWVISFSRGGSFGPARYGLEPGCTHLPTRIMAGNCITERWRSPASCKRHRIRCR